jgi:hypothetical protein
MRPIVTTARAHIEPGADVRVPVALRMPNVPLSATRMLAACDGMIEAARQFEAVLVAEGLPVDFLAQFADARDALARGMERRATHVGTHIAARAGLKVQLRRGRLAVDRLDAIVRASFRGDEMTLAVWRGTKRVHQRPGGVGPRVPLAEEAVEAAA